MKRRERLTVGWLEKFAKGICRRDTVRMRSDTTFADGLYDVLFADREVIFIARRGDYEPLTPPRH